MASMQRIRTADAPAAIGPYSQGQVAAGLVFTAGQIPLDPESMTVIEGDVAVQTDRVMRNLAAVLEAAGSSLSAVVKTTVFLTDMDDFAAMNEVYGRHFGSHAPARSTVQVGRLPKDVLVEIDAIALAARPEGG